MKKWTVLFAIIGLTTALVGCNKEEQKQPEQPKELIGKANPASVYCEEQGGKLEMKQEEKGTVGYCHLADGKVVEEWAFYRENNK
ncbi:MULTISPECIES: DUF333 domain-containing protein [unclassified Photobacterium]|uniref:putative hemolysin n=1 Tax=unclassified Photobacterium TaxID=2628852 RepID=UPI001EE06626|nr:MULTISPECIES: DUF333 domain-containing protein [unclassified Photobacterium]MCG3863661.1 DUF333 domain-containing protein [Photobacterium sp. Ph6]MCG3875240.1 DUF333 domain-containing protein [Photobacterium sp. Ph5]